MNIEYETDFLVEHLYKCEKNEYMECCSPISAYLPRDLKPQFILICISVLMKSYSETSCVGGSCLILTSSFELAPGCPVSPENLGLILFLWLMTRSLPNSWNCQSSEAYSALKCGLYREYLARPGIQSCLVRMRWARMLGKVFFVFPRCQTEP